MATAEWRLTVRGTGPLFDGRAHAAVDEFTHRATLRVAETGRDWIQIDANEMDRSGRGGTGRAAAGVRLEPLSNGWMISGGIHEGDFAWPWLEGTSRRNSTTRFGGYHTFRKTKNRLSDHLMAIVQPLVDDMVREMGGS